MTEKIAPVAAAVLPKTSSVKSRNVCSMPANQTITKKFTATATPTPGTRTAARNAVRSSGTARRTLRPRASGGSDSGSVRRRRA